MRTKKQKISIEESLGLTGEESAFELYNLHIKLRNQGQEKNSNAVKELWKKRYYAEKK